MGCAIAGLQVLGTDGEPLALSAGCLDACPRDLNAIPGYSGDDRTLDKLLDGSGPTIISTLLLVEWQFVICPLFLFGVSTYVLV
eukprot:scaffold240265_cov17-Prasinocladus_malaysianus.AAC.1